MENLDPVTAALLGLVILIVNGMVELVKHALGKNAKRNGSFTADDREKLTELRIYQKQTLEVTKEQTILLTQMRDSLKILCHEDRRSATSAK